MTLGYGLLIFTVISSSSFHSIIFLKDTHASNFHLVSPRIFVLLQLCFIILHLEYPYRGILEKLVVAQLM